MIIAALENDSFRLILEIIGSLIAVGSAAGTYFILPHRMSVLERDLKKQDQDQEVKIASLQKQIDSSNLARAIDHDLLIEIKTLLNTILGQAGTKGK